MARFCLSKPDSSLSVTGQKKSQTRLPMNLLELIVASRCRGSAWLSPSAPSNPETHFAPIVIITGPATGRTLAAQSNAEANQRHGICKSPKKGNKFLLEPSTDANQEQEQ